jgi:predicted ATPase
MFLKQLILENIRSIQYLDLSFEMMVDSPRRWTLILGENGTGKSTILRSLALLFAGSEGQSKLMADPGSWIRQESEEGMIRVKFMKPNGQVDDLQLMFMRGLDLRKFYDNNRDHLDKLDRIIQEADHRYLTLGYGASRRLSSKRSASVKGETFLDRRSQSLVTLFDPNATLNPLEAWATDLHYRRGGEGLTLIRQAFADLLPGVRFHEINRERRELLFETADGILPLDLLSDGYQNVAAWWGDLLFRITEMLPRIKNPLGATGLLLVDDIDLHLHPIWQRQLRDFLLQKLPNFQIVATTHSPLTAQQAGEGELFFLTRPSETAAPVMHAYDGNPQYLQIQQVVTSPVFGVDTVMSKSVAELRNEYRHLRQKKEHTEPEARQLQELRRQLEDLPDPIADTERDRRQMALLEKINEELQRSGND